MTKNITIVGDPHVQLNNLDVITQLFNDIENMGNDCIILGDLFHSKSIIRAECLNLVYERLNSSKLKYTLLVGNHDRINNHAKEHSLTTLKTLLNVKVVDHTLETTINNNKVAFVSYVHDINEFRQTLKNIKADIVFCHADIKGFDYGNGHISTSGLELEDLSHFPSVVSGHYHAFQIKDNIIYLGTPFSHSFGESNQEKYLGIWDTESGNLEVVPTKYRKHITLNVNCDSPINIQTNDFDLFRVVLTGSAEAIEAFDRTKYNNVKFIERPDQVENIAVLDQMSNLTQFEHWAKAKRIEADTIQLGLEILKQCEN
jgi:DNA repair exonuclease SbcCD nuclease subunit